MPTKANTTARKPRNVKAAPVAAPAPEAPAIDRAALRAAAAASFAKLHAAHGGSIAIKPACDFKPKPVTASFLGTDVTTRACATVAAAFLAGGVKLADGNTAKRAFTTDAGAFVLENGGLKRAVLCGLVTVNNAAGTLTLRAGATAAIRSHLGSALPRDS
jgi:hypothetical protein